MDISVIVPVRNGSTVLARQLRALTNQSYAGDYEVIVVNNNSTDDSLSVAMNMARLIPILRVLDAPEASGISDALNLGVENARAPLLLTTDQDDWVDHGWVEAMERALRNGSLASGATYMHHEPLEYEHFDDANFDSTPRIHGGFLPFAMNCNMGFTAALFEDLGGFDPTMDQAQDVDFSWRAQLKGYDFVFAEGAKLVKSLRSQTNGRFRQHLGYGHADVLLERRFGRDGYGGLTTRAFKQLAYVALHSRSLLTAGPRASRLAAVAGSAFGVLLAKGAAMLPSSGTGRAGVSSIGRRGARRDPRSR